MMDLWQQLRGLVFYGIRRVQSFFFVSGFTIAHAGRPFEPLNFAASSFFWIGPMFYAGMALYLLTATAMPPSTRKASSLDVAATRGVGRRGYPTPAR